MGYGTFRKKTPEQIEAALAKRREYYQNNKHKYAEAKKGHYRRNREKYLTLERDRAYKKRYGIDLAKYDQMLAEQGGRCAICRSATGGNDGRCFAVDHCHNTGRVRGLLCNACNVRLGWFDLHKHAVNDYLLGRHKRPSRSDRYRLKDVEAYRARKNAWAKLPEQKEKRRLAAKEWRAANREHVNAYARERRARELLEK